MTWRIVVKAYQVMGTFHDTIIGTNERMQCLLLASCCCFFLVMSSLLAWQLNLFLENILTNLELSRTSLNTCMRQAQRKKDQDKCKEGAGDEGRGDGREVIQILLLSMRQMQSILLGGHTSNINQKGMEYNTQQPLLFKSKNHNKFMIRNAGLYT